MKKLVNDILCIIIGMLMFWTGTAIYISMNPESNIKLDLPEEYSQATSTDTLIAIKQGDTLFVQFNNK